MASTDITSFRNACLNNYKHPEDLTECMTMEGQPYIPYKLAKLYITKIVTDMEQLKLKHKKIIKEIQASDKQNQDQAILALRKHYQTKMKNLKLELEAYHDINEKKHKEFQNKIKDMEKEKEHLIQEKASILFQLMELKEQMECEKSSKEEIKKTEYLQLEHAKNFGGGKFKNWIKHTQLTHYITTCPHKSDLLRPLTPFEALCLNNILVKNSLSLSRKCTQALDQTSDGSKT
ncbi:uncharacterized protein LOC128647190 [Bombina bombina]|uniref:uncharacterized protein LOC128647190 n=1 Tax=Bombina bombina TaxID=8345 RepID=UPI00235AAAB3|nr:uncharacterized protein LOC128647190 [Bombina bombina]